MARFEKGKGARKRSVTIQQIGTVLIKDEVDGLSEMLTGYRRFANERAAKAALASEAAALMGEGLSPADEEAKALTAGMPSAKSSAKPTLPLRRDIFVYNEATGMMFTSERMAGKNLDEGTPAWNKAIAKGDILPISLMQDDPFLVRIVVGGELDAAESEEWVARVDWHLNVKDGKLCVTGGSALVNEEYDADDSYTNQFIRRIEIPKGHYRVAVYSYIHGVNGKAALDALAGGYDKSEPIAEWFRRTRDGSENPYDADDEREYIHFLAHLTPVDAPPKTELSEAPNESWFGEAVNPRKPERCPLGLLAREVTGRVEESSGDWLFAYDAFKYCATYEPTAISDGPVSLPLNQIAAVPWLSWFGSRLAITGMRATLPGAPNTDFNAGTPEGIIAVPLGKEIRFAFSSDLLVSQLLPLLGQLESALRLLPDGTVLEICSAQPTEVPSLNELAGLLRFVGVLRGGTWQVQTAYPAVTAATLTRAVELAKEAQQGQKLAVRDAEEGAAIVKWATDNFGERLEDSPAIVEDGSLRLQQSDPNALALYAVAAFAVRFGDVWEVVALSEDEEFLGFD